MSPAPCRSQARRRTAFHTVRFALLCGAPRGVNLFPARTRSAVTHLTLAPSHRYLVLGTDTDVGKTHVCAALCLTLLAAGKRVVACKPVETGIATVSDLAGVARSSDLHVIERACAG